MAPMTLWGPGGRRVVVHRQFPARKGHYPLADQYLGALLAGCSVPLSAWEFCITALISWWDGCCFWHGWVVVGARAFGSVKIPRGSGCGSDYYRDAFWIAVGGGESYRLRRLLGMLTLVAYPPIES